MNCQNCGATIQSDYCQVCGTSQKQYIQKMNSEKTYQPKKSLNSKQIIAIVSAVIGLLFLVIKAWPATVIFILMSIILISVDASVKNKEKRIVFEKQQRELGNEKVLVCPKCKKPNIHANLVQKGTYSTGTKTTVSRNINPLRPFTHTNLNTSGGYTQNIYGSVFLCDYCGHTFEKPDEVWKHK